MATYPLKDDYRKGSPLHLLSVSWLNWVANFFNTVVFGNGLTATITSTGLGCSVSTVGITGVYYINNSWLADLVYEITIEDGRIIRLEAA
jgi:hypothetical protein